VLAPNDPTARLLAVPERDPRTSLRTPPSFELETLPLDHELLDPLELLELLELLEPETELRTPPSLLASAFLGVPSTSKAAAARPQNLNRLLHVTTSM
jgi:hypothetical protein